MSADLESGKWFQHRSGEAPTTVVEAKVRQNHCRYDHLIAKWTWLRTHEETASAGGGHSSGLLFLTSLHFIAFPPNCTTNTGDDIRDNRKTGKHGPGGEHTRPQTGHMSMNNLTLFSLHSLISDSTQLCIFRHVHDFILPARAISTILDNCLTFCFSLEPCNKLIAFSRLLPSHLLSCTAPLQSISPYLTSPPDTPSYFVPGAGC